MIIFNLIDCLIFCFLYIPMSKGRPYWFNLLLYIIAFILKTLIIYKSINYKIIIFYVIVGVILVYLLQKIVDSISPFLYMLSAIFIQWIITLSVTFLGLFTF